ncbi:MAG TPA: AAA family ATPase [Ilumatobacteraceae bacterium]
MDVERLGAATILRGGDVDAEKTRERTRQRRLLRLAVVLIVFLVWMWSRLLSGQDIGIGLPSIPQGRSDILISLGLMVCLAALILTPMIAAGRSPHVLFRPSETGVSLSDVVGAPQTTREAIDTLNLFLAHRTFTKELGGKPRRGVLFEGPPGTGKTYLAKAMAGEAGVPFLFVSASAFQSMYYGQTNRKIRTYFKALRKAARKEGGAIGFIEEFDAIGASRSSMGSSTMREGVTGIVSELLVQMQSFDMPTGGMKMVTRLIDFVNLWLPTTRHLRAPRTTPANVLIIAATNRAADLDPALLRPGRFDRIIHFDLPPRTDRAAIAEYYLARKAHGEDVSADDIAGLTTGYSPVSIERLLDEALICALRHGRRQMTTKDVLQAKLVTELGLSHDAGYQPEERRRIAVHEAGHALLAELCGRRVNVASILRRSDALGLVSHVDSEERHLFTPQQAMKLIHIALGGMVAEELEFGEASSGISSDLAAATTIAAQLVGSMGAGGSRLSLEAASVPGAANLVAKVLGDEASRAAAERIIHDAETAARELMTEHRAALLAIATALHEQDELSGDEVRAIVAEHASAVAAAAPAQD